MINIFREDVDKVNLYSWKTGIDLRIEISSRIPNSIPIVNVYGDWGYFSLTINEPMNVVNGDSRCISHGQLELVKKWISLNKDLLFYYWEHPEMDTAELLERIEKVTY